MKKLVLVISLLLNVVIATVLMYGVYQRNKEVDISSTGYRNCGTGEISIITVTTYADGSQKVDYLNYDVPVMNIGNYKY